MADKILHKRSFTRGSTPTTSSLSLGELAINANDGKIFLKKSGSAGVSVQSAVTTDSITFGQVTLSGSLILSSSTLNNGTALDISTKNISFDFDVLAFSGSSSLTGSVSILGTTKSTLFTGSFSGNGSLLKNIPATGITGLNLSRIASGSATASISPNRGLVINTKTSITGSLSVTQGITGSLLGSSSYSLNSPYINTIGFRTYSENPYIEQGSKSQRHIGFDSNIVKVRSLANTNGYISINVKRGQQTLGTVNLSNQSSSFDTSLTGWDTTLYENDILEFYVSQSSTYINDISVFIDIKKR